MTREMYMVDYLEDTLTVGCKHGKAMIYTSQVKSGDRILVGAFHFDLLFSFSLRRSEV